MTSIKTKHLVTISCSLLIFLFVYTAINKLIAFERFKATLLQSPLTEEFSGALAWCLPLTELLTAFLLLIPKSQGIGLRLSFALMTLFTAYVAYMLLFARHMPCSCGGIISSLSWPQHLVVNIFFSLLSLAGIRLQQQTKIFIRINRTSRTPV